MAYIAINMSEIVWTEEQSAALATLKSWIKAPMGKPMMSLTGCAGTGKTLTMSELKNYFPVDDTLWTAMTGKAALRLSQSAGVEASTLHSKLYGRPTASGKRVFFNTIKKPSCDFLIIDESSQIGGKLYSDIETWTSQGVRVLLVGDSVQLPPILSYKEEQEYGDDFSVFREVKGPNLSKVMRSNDGIIEIATLVRESRKLPLKGNDFFKIQKVQYPGLAAIGDYLDDPSDHILITWTNAMRMQGNIEIRRRLGHKTPLPGKTEPVLICKNGQDVLNGEMVYAEKFEEANTVSGVKLLWMTTTNGQKLLVSASGQSKFMDGSLPDVKDWKEFHRQRNNLGYDEPLPITYGYVLTAHKMQGSDARRVSVYLSGTDMRNEHFNKDTILPDGSKMPFAIRWAYTSFTRPKERGSFYYS